MSDSSPEETEAHADSLNPNEVGDDEEDSGATGYNVKTSCSMCRSNKPVQKYCSSCAMWVCGSCVDIHSLLPALRSHILSDMEDKSVMSYDLCKQHPRTLMLYFCRPCAVPVCSDCQLKGQGSHVDHHCIAIERQADMNMKRLESNSELVSEDLKKYELRKQMLEAELLALNTEQIQMKSYIDRCEQQMKEVFDQWRLIGSRQHTELSAEIHKVLDWTQNNMYSLKTLQNKSKDNISLTNKSLMVSPDHNILYDQTQRFTKGMFTFFEEAHRDMKQFIADNLVTDDSSVDETQIWTQIVDQLSEILKGNLKKATVQSLDEHNISLVHYSKVNENVKEDEFTAVANAWVQTYRSFTSNYKQKPVPGQVRCYEEGYKETHFYNGRYWCYSYIKGSNSSVISKADILLLWRMFGHAVDEPMPIGQKEGFLSDGAYYIALVTEVDEESDGKRYGQTLTVLRRVGADLPPGDVYYEDQPNKIDEDFKPETNYCRLYVVNK